MDTNQTVRRADDLIDTIVTWINQAETTGDPSSFMEARRLLGNDLRALVASFRCRKEVPDELANVVPAEASTEHRL
jgi:hypothetical protein